MEGWAGGPASSKQLRSERESQFQSGVLLVGAGLSLSGCHRRRNERSAVGDPQQDLGDLQFPHLEQQMRPTQW